MPEIVIVGTGPAGLSAARVLAEAGREVLVLEKNKRPGLKICAGGITNTCLKLGIPKSSLEREFDSILFNLEGLKLRVGDSGKIIYTVRRTSLGAWLAKRAKDVGAEISYGAEVTGIGEKYVKVGKRKINFKYLIGADGSNSMVRRHLKLDSKQIIICIAYEVKGRFEELEVIFSRKYFPATYAWVFPYKNIAMVGTGYLSGVSAQKVRKNLDMWCMKRGYKIENRNLMVAPVNCDYRGFKFGNIFLAGDAAGLALNLTGEGISSAIISGEEVARGILNPNYDFPRINELLRFKEKQEKIRKMIAEHPYLARFGYFLMPALIQIPQFKQKFLRAAGLR